MPERNHGPRPDTDEPCPDCGGSGSLMFERMVGERYVQEEPECPACEGTGRRLDTKEAPDA